MGLNSRALAFLLGTVRADRASPVYFNIAELYTYEGLKQSRLCCIHFQCLTIRGNQRGVRPRNRGRASGVARPAHLEVALHGGQEAHVVRRLHVQLEELRQDRLQVGHEHGIGFLDHVQDFPDYGQLCLLMECAQSCVSLPPEFNLGQRTVTLRGDVNTRTTVIIRGRDTCGCLSSIHSSLPTCPR